MALSIQRVNEILWSAPSTIIFSDADWPAIATALGLQDRPPEACTIGRMQLRWTTGEYADLVQELSQLKAELASLKEQVHVPA